MADGALKIDARRRGILESLKRDGQVRVAQLAEALGASVVTIRSDLAALERDGYLQRVTGGAVQTVRNFYNTDFLERRQANAESKREIAQKVAREIHDGETLFINSGMTTYYVAEALKTRKNLNIVTNSLAIAMLLGAHPTFRVILLGGEVNAQYAFTCGSDALEQLRHYKADKAILSIDGIHEVSGLTTYHAEEAVVDRIMIDRSRETILAADHTKLGHESFSFVDDLTRAHLLVTDEQAEETVLAAFAARGLPIQRNGGEEDG